MSNHTPGPWHSVGECIMDGNIEVICTDPSAPAYEWDFVASVHYEADGTDANAFTKETGEANARLIAAAPDLLEACKDVLAEMRAYNAESEFDESCPMKPTFDQLKAAIAKAEGKETNHG